MSVEAGLLRPPSKFSNTCRFTVLSLALAGISACAAGCENTDPAEEADADPATDTSTFELSDANNCSARDTLTIPEIETASGVEITLDWSGFTEDLYRQPVSPAADIDGVFLLRFLNVDQATLMSRLAANDISPADIDASFGFVTDHAATSVALSALVDANDAPIDLDEAFIAGAGYTYLLTLSAGTTPGFGIRSMTFVTPSATATNNVVSVGPATGVLTRALSLGREALSVPLSGVWTMDWSGLTRDVLGAALPFDGIDKLALAYYPGQTTDALRQDYFGFISGQSQRWELALNGGATTASLGMAKEALADGAVGGYFSGFEAMTEGVWLLRLDCSTCMNPLPSALVVLEPTATP